MRRKSLIVALPDNWYEVPDESPKAYRRHGDESGTLRVSLRPPIEFDPRFPEPLTKRLSDLLDAEEASLGRCLKSGHCECKLGMMAYSLWMSEKHGLSQFWLIPSEVCVFASLQTADLGGARKQIEEAHEIVRSVYFEVSST